MAERLSAYMDKQRIGKMKAAYAELARLEAQRKALQTRFADLERQIPELEKAIKDAPRLLNEALNARARGAVTEEAVAALRKQQADNLSALEQLRVELRALRGGGYTVELSNAKYAAAAARQQLVNSVIDDLTVVIRSDPRLLERLDLVYASLYATSDAGVGLLGVTFDWSLVLQQIFPNPDDAKHAEIMAKHAADMPAVFQAAA